MTLSTRGACLTQSSTFLSRIISSAQDSRPLKCLVVESEQEAAWESESLLWASGGRWAADHEWCRCLDKDFRTPQHVCFQTSPRLPPGLPFHPGASLAPSPSPIHRACYTLTPFVSSHPAPSAASEDPFRTLPAPCKGRGVFRTPRSCPQTGVSQKVPVRAELKISPGSR